MKAVKKVTLILLTLLLLFSLCSCGSKESDSKSDKISNSKSESKSEYSEELDKIDKYLADGRYDDAIKLINEIKQAEYLKDNKDKLQAEEMEFIKKIVGEYRRNNLSSDDNINKSHMTINEDMTITIDANTYPYSVNNKEKGDGPAAYYIRYAVNNSSGTTTEYSITFNLDKYDWITTDNGYIKVDQFDAIAAENFAPYVASYESYDGQHAISINADFTAMIDGTSYPIEYIHNYDGKILYYVMGYDRYKDDPWFAGTYKNSELNIEVDDMGFVTLWNGYVVSDSVELVNITSENIDDYFEWTDWEVTGVEKNAFDEIQYISVNCYYQLKKEYAQRFLRPMTSVAIELEYYDVSYYDSVISLNLDTKEADVTLGTKRQNDYTYNSIISYINDKRHYDSELNKEVIDSTYLFSPQIGLNMERLTSENGANLTFTRTISDSFFTGNYTITRSNFILALKKPN